MKLLLIVAASLLTIIVATNLFNNGHVTSAFGLALLAVATPIYLHFRKGIKKDENS